MSKCRYDLSEDCNNTDCLDCVLGKIEEEVNSQNRGDCDYLIVDRIDEIIRQVQGRS